MLSKLGLLVRDSQGQMRRLKPDPRRGQSRVGQVEPEVPRAPRRPIPKTKSRLALSSPGPIYKQNCVFGDYAHGGIYISGYFYYKPIR